MLHHCCDKLPYLAWPQEKILRSDPAFKILLLGKNILRWIGLNANSTSQLRKHYNKVLTGFPRRTRKACARSLEQADNTVCRWQGDVPVFPETMTQRGEQKGKPQVGVGSDCEGQLQNGPSATAAAPAPTPPSSVTLGMSLKQKEQGQRPLPFFPQILKRTGKEKHALNSLGICYYFTMAVQHREPAMA